MSEKKQEKPQLTPTISVRLYGPDIVPETVSVGQMMELMSAVRSLAGTDLRMKKVKRSSAGYLMVAEDPVFASESLNRSGMALDAPFDYLNSEMIRAFDTLKSVVRRLKCRLEVKALDGSWKWNFRGSKWDEIRQMSIIEDEASVYGELKRVGGATGRRCSLKIPGRKRILYCNIANDSAAKRLGKHLYENVGLHGRGKFFVKDWSILSFTVHSVTMQRKVSFEQMREEIREAGGKDWDQIEDPLNFLRELRGESEF